MAALVYGRAQRSSGGPSAKKHLRHQYALDPEKSVYKPKPGYVGPPAPVMESKVARGRPSSNPHLRLRRLACGHDVFMVRGQFPDADTFCVKCQ